MWESVIVVGTVGLAVGFMFRSLWQLVSEPNKPGGCGCGCKCHAPCPETENDAADEATEK